MTATDASRLRFPKTAFRSARLRGLFRDELTCPNALYFDGSVSRLLVTGEKRDSFGPPLGPILGVYEKQK